MPQKSDTGHILNYYRAFGHLCLCLTRVKYLSMIRKSESLLQKSDMQNIVKKEMEKSIHNPLYPVHAKL